MASAFAPVLFLASWKRGDTRSDVERIITINKQQNEDIGTGETQARTQTEEEELLAEESATH